MTGKRVLIITPGFPVPETGAEQSDRATGMRQLRRLGHEVRVIAKLPGHADANVAEAAAATMGVGLRLVPYRYSNRVLSPREKVVKHVGKLRNPLYLDGAAYEYAETGIQQALIEELDTFKPDVVWFEYTYLWPLYSLVRTRGIPIITRSINFEPVHFLEEDGRTFVNYLRYIPKYIGERLSIQWSDAVLSITPKEEEVYRRMGAPYVETLPLRGLPRFTTLPRPEIRTRTPLHCFFMGSSYHVSHNRAALEAILTKIAPEAEKRMPGAFVFHVLGTKVPAHLTDAFNGVTTIYDGPRYAEELDAYIKDMDVAIVPSLMGAGQQQKVFEPITRGIPTITSPRAIAEYPLQKGVAYLPAHTPEEFVEALKTIQQTPTRETLSAGATEATKELFAQEKLDAIVTGALEAALSKGLEKRYN